MSKLLVVVGATGFQGGSVISWFQRNQPLYKIRGLTRDPSSDAAKALAKTGVEVVKADLSDLESLTAAFKGASYIFAYTDFGGILESPDVMGKFEAGEIAAPVGAESGRIEMQYGKNVADAAATVPELERLVWSTLADAKKWSKGKYTHVFHFNAKAAVSEYMLSLKALEGKVSLVQLGIFTNNVAKSLPMFQIRIQKDKTAIWQPPFPKDLPLPWIDIESDVGAFVKMLIDAPAPTHVLAVSEWKTCTEFLELWSKVTGFQGRLDDAEPETDADTDPSGLKEQFAEVAQFVEEFGLTGGDPTVLMPEDCESRGFHIPRSRIADYFAREDWSAVAKSS